MHFPLWYILDLSKTYENNLEIQLQTGYPRQPQIPDYTLTQWRPKVCDAIKMCEAILNSENKKLP